MSKEHSFSTWASSRSFLSYGRRHLFWSSPLPHHRLTCRLAARPLLHFFPERPPSLLNLLRSHALLPGEKDCASHRTRRSVVTHLLAVTPSSPLCPFCPCLLPLPSHHLMSSQVPPSPPHWLSLMSANPFLPHCHGKAQKWERGCGHCQSQLYNHDLLPLCILFLGLP